MILDVTSVISGKADALDVDYQFLPSDVENGELFIPDGVTLPNPVHVSGTFQNQAGLFTLRAAADVNYETVCARCLDPLAGTLSLRFERTVVLKAPESGELPDEYLLMTDGKLRIDEELFEEMMLSFPLRFLCSEDCPGLCPKCGKPLREGDCGCPKKEIDPRLAKLQKLLDL